MPSTLLASCCCCIHSLWCRFNRSNMCLCIFLYYLLYMCSVICTAWRSYATLWQMTNKWPYSFNYNKQEKTDGGFLVNVSSLLLSADITYLYYRNSVRRFTASPKYWRHNPINRSSPSCCSRDSYDPVPINIHAFHVSRFLLCTTNL